MEQTELAFYEAPEEALKAAVNALGGSKRIGPLLWPDKSQDAAARLLLDCLNPARPEKLDLSQTMLILRLSKEAGCYAPFLWIAAEVGYMATPVAKADEEDRLATVIEQAGKTLETALAKLERLQEGRGRHE